MIDTVCLLVPKHKLIMLDLSGSGVPTWNLQSRTGRYDKFVRNPPKNAHANGLYFPRLTGYKRGQDETVRIEFSAPKLLYLNNLDELQDDDFSSVIETLCKRLQMMGVVATEELLKSASVTSVHFSKNILLEDGYTASHLISEMNKVNLRKSFDFARTRYINDGQSLYAHTTAHELVIYDKIADLGKDKKRAIDKEQSPYQCSLFTELNKPNQLVEVLRLEIRLNHKQKMNAVLEQLGYTKDPTFKNVFNVEMSQKVVKSYWERLIKERSLGLFSVSLSLKEILRTLFIADAKLKPKQAIYYTGLFMLGRDENGMRELRSIVTKKSHERTWYRIVEDMQKACDLITKNKVRDWVTQLDRQLDEYKPYKHKRMTPQNPFIH